MTRNKTTLLVGIDIGSHMIRALAAYTSRDSVHPVPQLSLELPTEGVDRGRITDKEEVASTIKKLILQIEEELDEKVKHVVISIAPAGLSSLHLTGFTRTTRGDALVTDIDIDQAVRDGASHLPDIKNKNILHELPIKFKLDGAEASLPIIGLRANKLEIKTLYITLQRQLLDAVKDTLTLASVEASDIVAGPLALSVPLLTKKERKSGCLLLDIGAATTSLVVYENNTPLLVSSLPLGGQDITKDIAIGLKQTIEDAEEIKHGTSPILHSKRRVEEIIEARIADICEKINKELDSIHRRELLPSGVIVSGQGARIPRIEHLLRAELRLPIKFAENTLLEFTHGSLNDIAFAKCYGSLFFIKDVTEREVFFEAFSSIFKKLKRYISRFLP